MIPALGSSFLVTAISWEASATLSWLMLQKKDIFLHISSFRLFQDCFIVHMLYDNWQQIQIKLLQSHFDFMTVDEGGQCGLGGNGWSILICWLANGPTLSSIQPGIPGISQLLKGAQLAVGLRAIRLIVNQAPYLDRCWFCQNNCPRGNWVVYISEVGQTLFHPLPLPPFWPLFCLNLPDKLLAKI